MFDRKVFYGSLLGLAVAFIGSNLVKFAVPRPVSPELLAGNVSVIANYSVFDPVKPFGGFSNPFDFVIDQLCMKTTRAEINGFGLDGPVACLCGPSANTCDGFSMPQAWSALTNWLECQADKNCYQGYQDELKLPKHSSTLDPAHWNTILGFANTCQCYESSMIAWCALDVPSSKRLVLNPEQWSNLVQDKECGIIHPEVNNGKSPIGLNEQETSGYAEYFTKWYQDCEKAPGHLSNASIIGCYTSHPKHSDGPTSAQIVSVLGCHNSNILADECGWTSVGLKKRVDLSDPLAQKLYAIGQIWEVLDCPSKNFVNGLCLAGPPPSLKRSEQAIEARQVDSLANSLVALGQAQQDWLVNNCPSKNFVNGLCLAGPPPSRKRSDEMMSKAEVREKLSPRLYIVCDGGSCRYGDADPSDQSHYGPDVSGSPPPGKRSEQLSEVRDRLSPRFYIVCEGGSCRYGNPGPTNPADGSIDAPADNVGNGR